MQITLVAERSGAESAESADHTGRYTRLIADLERYAETRVNIVEDLSGVSLEGFVLLSSTVPLSTSLAACAEHLRAALPSRLVLLEVSWQKALEQLEKYKLAGLVDSLRFAEWMAGAPPGFGPYGRRELLEQSGAICAALPFLSSDNYCLLQSDRHPGGLPHLLADYLAAYERKGLLAYAEVHKGVYAAG